MTQVSYIQDLVPTHNPDGLGTYIIMVHKTIPDPFSPVNCTCLRLIPKERPTIEPTTFNLASIQNPVKVLGFNDNIVIQTVNELVIFNLTKERDLSIKFATEGEELVDVYIDHKSRIYAASWHKILFVSLKNQAFETVYQKDDIRIINILHISETF